MQEGLTLTGIVLLAAPVGDYDKRLVVLTRERGKITVFARGCRRSRSQLMAVANPFVFASFQVYERRDSYSLLSADIQHPFTEISKLIPGVYYGFYFMEFAAYYGVEGLEGRAMVDLLFVTLKQLEKGKLPLPLIRSIFELKLMVINGEYPQMFACINCGSRENLHHLHPVKGGLICDQCLTGAVMELAVSETLTYTMKHIITAPVTKLFTFTLTKEAEEELGEIMRILIRLYIDKKFKSLEILEMMC